MCVTVANVEPDAEGMVTTVGSHRAPEGVTVLIILGEGNYMGTWPTSQRQSSISPEKVRQNQNDVKQSPF